MHAHFVTASNLDTLVTADADRLDTAKKMNLERRRSIKTLVCLLQNMEGRSITVELRNLTTVTGMFNLHSRSVVRIFCLARTLRSFC